MRINLRYFNYCFFSLSCVIDQVKCNFAIFIFTLGKIRSFGLPGSNWKKRFQGKKKKKNRETTILTYLMFHLISFCVRQIQNDFSS